MNRVQGHDLAVRQQTRRRGPKAPSHDCLAMTKLSESTGFDSRPGRPTRGSGCWWPVTIATAARHSGHRVRISPAKLVAPSVASKAGFRCRPNLSSRMVDGMATKKITITLEVAQLDRIRELVEAGKASSVSGFVQHAVGVSLDDIAGWGALLAQALQDTGGPLSRDEKAWADEMLGNQKRRTRSVA